VGGQRHASAALPAGKTRYPLYRRLGGSQGRSERLRKRSPPLGFDPRTVQPVASRYTDWTIPAQLRRCMVRRVWGRTSINGDLYQSECCRSLGGTVRSTPVAERRRHQSPGPFVIPAPCTVSPSAHNTSRPINYIFNWTPSYYCVVPL